MKRFRKYCMMAGIAAMAMIPAVSCDTADELPPLNEGYATTVIMPDPVDLTDEERDYIRELQDEYNQAIAND